MTTDSKPKKHLPKIILAIALVVGGFFGFQKYRYATTHEDTDNAQVEAYFIPVLPRMGGFVKSVHVSDYDQVKKGQLLVEIDAEEAQLALQEMEIDLAQAQSDVENAQANITNLKKGIDAQQSQVAAAELLKNKSARDLTRNRELVNAKAITHQQFLDSQDQSELATVKYQGAKADLISTQSKMAILEANLHKAQAILQLKRVKIDQQKLRLTYANIVAPADGKIGKKAVEPGQFVQVSQPLMTVMNDTKYWVVANFKETQVDALRAGMDAEIKIDAYPALKIKGRILSISESTGAKNTLLPPDNSSGNFVKVTQRVPVKIEILDAQKYKGILRAGLSLEVSIPLK